MRIKIAVRQFLCGEPVVGPIAYSTTTGRSGKTIPVCLFIFCLILAVVFCCLYPAEKSFADVEPGQASWRIKAERWAEAEQIFRSDPCWLGGDGATSVDLGDKRVLWLFGDSFIDLSGTGSRQSSTLVRNTIAVQDGYDPTAASMDFVWKISAGLPIAFFFKSSNTWYWPASGIVMGGNLLVFLMEIRAAENALGFESCGWKAAWIDNPQDPPDHWHLTWLISPQQQGLVVGAGTPVLENGFLRVFVVDGQDRSVFMARWPAAAAFTGTLTEPQWWTGEPSGWVSDVAGKKDLAPVFAGGQMEFTVTRNRRQQGYLRIQTGDFLNPCLAVSTAPALTGPWSDAVCFFSPPEKGVPELLIYAGKFHPMLRGADLVLSYVVNTSSVDRLFSDMGIYFPVLLKGEFLFGTDR